MPYGEVIYDKLMDAYMCEFPVKENGRMRVCGKWCKDLARHITRHHRMTTQQYKKLLGLDMKESLMSRESKRKLKKANFEKECYKNLELGKPYRLKPGRTTIQKYKRSEQTKRRLRTLRKDSKQL